MRRTLLIYLLLIGVPISTCIIIGTVVTNVMFYQERTESIKKQIERDCWPIIRSWGKGIEWIFPCKDTKK